MSAVKVEHRKCGASIAVEMPGGLSPDACPDCGAILDPSEVLADSLESLAEDERLEARRIRLAEIHHRRQQVLSH